MIRRTNLTTWLIISVFLAGFAPAVAAGGTIYVDADASPGGDGTTWGTAYKYLQDALYKPPTGGDEIWVAEGTYKPDEDEAANVTPDDRTETFQLINGVAIYGGFAGGESSLDERDWQTNETILSGDINVPDVNADNSYHVVEVSNYATAVLDGFTITAGNANGSWPYDSGGGMYNFVNFSSPTVTNCTFSGNSAFDNGGGMFNNQSSPTVTDCNFSGNSAGNDGGGMFNFLVTTTVINCTFSGNSAGSGGGGGIYCERSNSTIANCTIKNNSALWGGGMYNYLDGSSATITNCTFSGNSATWGGGMGAGDESSPTVTNCTFSGNSAGNYGGGMLNWGAGGPTVTNCILWGNIAPSGAQIYNGSVTVSYSDIESCGGSGAGWDPNCGTDDGNNIDADPLFVDANGPDDIFGTADDDLRLLAGSPCIDAGNNTVVPADTADLDGDANTAEPIPFDLDGQTRFFDDLYTTDTGNGTKPVVDMGAYEYGDIIYVDGGATGANNGTSWEDAYNYLQDALAYAAGRNEPVKILMVEGTYKPDEDTANQGGTNLRTDTFGLINGVAIYGGFPSGGGKWSERDPNAYETILSGDIGVADVNTDNSYHVVTGSYTEPNAVLDGFTITAGNANGSWPKNAGGGMYNASGSPTTANCTFSGNSANFGGGMFNNSSSPTVTNCTFSGNSATNNGGGMQNGSSCSPTVTNCTFSGNSTTNYGGGMYNAASSPELVNCTFTGNLAGQVGGGMFNENNSSPTVINCTFSGNSAGDNCGGIYNNSSDPNITNCILWGNTDSGPTDESAQIYNSGSTPDVNYCCIEGLDTFVGGGNIGNDPLFKDADLSLSFDSPCIDAGDNNSVPADTADLDNDGNTVEPIPFDLAGNARFTDDPVVVDTGNPAPGYPEIVEMGAYERYEFCGSGAYPYPPGDVSGPDGVPDCYLDFYDFAVWATYWLEYTGPE